MARRRMPAEWEEQGGVLLPWPHPDTDWAPWLPEVEACFLTIARAVTRFERLLVAAQAPEGLGARLAAAGCRMDRVRVRPVALNDTWARDFGPLAVEEGAQRRLLDFGFNGWGLKFACADDNQATRRLHRLGAFGDLPLETVGLVLEGGSVESDGRGTVLTTAECLLGPNRNPHLDRAGVEAALGRYLGAERVLWLEHGRLAGDDTDAHVDTLARFAPGDTLIYQGCDDPEDPHFEPLGAMAEELRRFRTPTGEPYRLVPLPWPQAVWGDGGERLPATYANFLIVNGAVLVPTYRGPRDGDALAAVAGAFPGREVVGVDCRPLLRQHGSLHCVTMQLPKGGLP